MSGRRLSCFVLTFLAMDARANPTITSLAISGATMPATGQTWTITTTGAGTKSPAKPVLWDNFETGDGIPSTLGTLTSYAGSGGIAVGSSGCYAGTYCATSSAGWLNSSTGANLQVATGLKYGDKFYVSFKRKSSQTPYYVGSDATENTKTFRVWHGSVGGAVQNWYVGTQATGSTIVVAEQIGTQVTNTTRYFPSGSFSQPSSSFQTEEYLLLHNSALGAQDGSVELRINNTSSGVGTGFQMDESGKPAPDDLAVIQQVLANNGSGQWCVTGNVTFDDIYVDTGTWARVMLGNAATYAASTQFEMQIPSAWSATSITVTSNYGALSGGSKWLYVCDSNDSCNSAGYNVGLVGKSVIFPKGVAH